MTTSLAPALLISMPQMTDPNFSRSVVLLVRHDEEGAFGLVINRPRVTTGRVSLSVNDEEEVSTERELHVWIGGPVEPQRSWMLVDEAPGEEAEGMAIADGLFLSTSPELLRQLLSPAPPPRARLVVGYSGWGAGQLEAELEASAWLLSDVDAALVFDTPPESLWEAAIRRLGVDPHALHMSHGVH